MPHTPHEPGTTPSGHRSKPHTLAPLGRKQASDHAHWQAVARQIVHDYPRPLYLEILGTTLTQIRATIARHGWKRLAFGWSGGKDSVALEFVMRAAGISECVLVISRLEYRAFLEWVTDHMPRRLTVVQTGQDLRWLAAHPEMLFPKDAATAGKWFKLVQHTGQDRYYREERLDCLILGRRRADGNHVGPAGRDVYTNAAGITRWSPLAHWTHEQLLACIHYEGLPLPPTYDWPRGYQVGTGPWPARQFAASPDAAWDEVWQIDPSVVEDAAAHHIPGAVDAWNRNVQVRPSRLYHPE